MDEIMNILIKIVAMLLALGAGYLGKYVVNWLKSNLDDRGDEKLDTFIAELVAAAEQMYKKDDPEGTARLHYVQTMLIGAGYDITDAIQAVIESKVFEINLTNR